MSSSSIGSPRSALCFIISFTSLNSPLGAERVVRSYFHTINESGLWMVVPFEEQAYQLDARYTGDSADVFSVEEEVRKWAEQGRF